ncbi:MAG: hypothetical protein BWY79_01740 [Actinobacteria bacterium ADurb.Bin444]|nr:MAG: hypothetical protein BWY79_01740 [Actinobacteria bacterium ADurb.Bin444]
MDGVIRRRLRCRQHPTHLAEALFCVHEVRDHLDIGFILQDPVGAGETRIEYSVLHVAGHLLGPDKHALDLGIVDGREIRAHCCGDMESRPPK